MVKLGRLSAIRSARLDTLHDLRDATTRLLNYSSKDEDADIKTARACLDRLEELRQIEVRV